MTRHVILSRQPGRQRCVQAAGDVSTHSLGFLLDQVVLEVPVTPGSPWVQVFLVSLEDLVDLVNPGIRTRQIFSSDLTMNRPIKSQLRPQRKIPDCKIK